MGRSVKAELIEKGCTDEQANLIGDFVCLSGNDQVASLLSSPLSTNAQAKSGLEDMKLLLSYCECFHMASTVCFDMSLARGLDYYTGPIFEAVLVDHPIGTISAGGRYDDLIGMFSGKKIPCVGFSVGLDRLCSIFEPSLKTKKTKVLVVGMGSGCLDERLIVLQELWAAGIAAETFMKPKPKMQPQFDYCDKELIPFSVIIGDNEVDSQMVSIKDMGKAGSGQVQVSRTAYIQTLLDGFTSDTSPLRIKQ